MARLYRIFLSKRVSIHPVTTRPEKRAAIQYFRNELGTEVGDMLVSAIQNESRNTARDMQEEDIRGR